MTDAKIEPVERSHSRAADVILRLDVLEVSACTRADARLLVSETSPRSIVFDLRHVRFGPSSVPFLNELMTRARAEQITLRFVHASRRTIQCLHSAGLQPQSCHRSPRGSRPHKLRPDRFSACATDPDSARAKH